MNGGNPSIQGSGEKDRPSINYVTLHDRIAKRAIERGNLRVAKEEYEIALDETLKLLSEVRGAQESPQLSASQRTELSSKEDELELLVELFETELEELTIE